MQNPFCLENKGQNLLFAGALRVLIKTLLFIKESKAGNEVVKKFYISTDFATRLQGFFPVLEALSQQNCFFQNLMKYLDFDFSASAAMIV